MDMVSKVGGAILLAETEWSPKSGVSKERAMALAAIEAMRITEDAPAGNAFGNAFALVKSDWNAAIDAALRPSS